MSNVKWIKLSINMFEDEKIRLIEQMPDADTILIIWVKLLSQAGKTNTSGYIFLSENIPYTDEMLSTIFNRPIGTVRLALAVFKQFGMIDIDEDSFISISNWERHQNVAGLEKLREQTRKRVAKHRENKRLDDGNEDVTLLVTQGNATELELDIELDIDKEREIKKSNSRKQVYDKSSIHFQLAERLYKKILTNNPNHKKPNLQIWAKDVRLMMERDNRTEKQIAYAIDWCQDNDFWMANILSVDKLRKKFDTLIMQIKKDPNKPVKAPIYKGSESDGRSNEPDTRKNGHVKLYK